MRQWNDEETTYVLEATVGTISVGTISVGTIPVEVPSAYPGRKPAVSQYTASCTYRLMSLTWLYYPSLYYPHRVSYDVDLSICAPHLPASWRICLASAQCLRFETPKSLIYICGDQLLSNKEAHGSWKMFETQGCDKNRWKKGQG